jgi:Ran GTPase-activating protein (RanGAP) involved in mRNA processing and transport
VNRSLTSLRLSKWRFFDFAATSILTDCLLDNCVVSHLDLSANSIGGPGAAAIARALTAGVPLERLDLASSRICDEGAIALAAAIVSGCTLRSLDVRRCEIGDAGIAALAGTVGEGFLPLDDAADGGRRGQGASALGFLLELQVWSRYFLTLT